MPHETTENKNTRFEEQEPQRWPEGIPLLTFDQYRENYPNFKEGDLVVVLDLPMDVVEKPGRMPTGARKVATLRDDIVRTRRIEDNSHSNGILKSEPIGIVTVPQQSDDPLLPGAHPIVNGFHRYAALQKLTNPEDRFYNSDFQRYICAIIEFGTWETVWKRRYQAQAGHIEVAPARLMFFTRESWEKTPWGRMIAMEDIIPYIGILDQDDVTTEHIHPQALKQLSKRYGVCEDVVRAALINVHMVIRGAHLTPNESISYLSIGRSLDPEISEMVRTHSDHSMKEYGEIPLSLATVIGEEFPTPRGNAIQRILYNLYIKNDDLPIRRAQECTFAARKLLPTLEQLAEQISQTEVTAGPPEDITLALLKDSLYNIYLQKTPLNYIEKVIERLISIKNRAAPDEIQAIIRAPGLWRKSEPKKGTRKQASNTKEKDVIRRPAEKIAVEFLRAGFENIELNVYLLRIVLQAHSRLAVHLWSLDQGLYRLDNGAADALASYMNQVHPSIIALITSKQLPLSPDSAREISTDICREITPLLGQPTLASRKLRTIIPEENLPLAELGEGIRRLRQTVDYRSMSLHELELMIQELTSYAERFGLAVQINTNRFGDASDSTREFLKYLDGVLDQESDMKLRNPRFSLSPPIVQEWTS